MAVEWETASVLELQDRQILFVEDGNHGEYRPRADEFGKEGTPFVRPDDLKNGRIDFAGCDRVNERARARIRKGKGQAGDIVFTHRATVGRIARAGGDAPPFIANPGVTVWRSTAPDILDPTFLYFFMQTASFMDQVWAEAGNTDTFPYVSLTQQRRLQISFPLITEQRVIAHILGTLDDKIEVNRRMSETLEAMARALFKSWFVDFEPARAKAEGRDPGLPPDIAALFPDYFAGSEHGEIPAGWEATCVGEEFDLTMGQSPPGDTYNEVGEGIPFYQGRADFQTRFPKRRIYCKAPNRFAKAGDTLISVRAPVGDINMAGEDCAIGRGVAAARHQSGSRSYTYQFMRGLEVVFARFEAEGTVFGSINKTDFHAIPCVAPPPQIVSAFEAMLAPMDDRIESAAVETSTLAALRDTLLPKLISGELRVKDAERFVREATA